MNYRQAFDILEIEPTGDRKVIKKAYAQLVKQYHPEEHPEKWQSIHDAYEYAMSRAGSRQEPVEIPREEQLARRDIVPREPVKTEQEYDFKNLAVVAQQNRLEQAKEYENTLAKSLEILAEQCAKKVQRARDWKSILNLPEIQMMRTNASFLYRMGDLLGKRYIGFRCYRVLNRFLKNVHHDLINSTYDEVDNKSSLDAWEVASKGLKQASNSIKNKVGALGGVAVVVTLLVLMAVHRPPARSTQSVTSRETNAQTEYALIYAERYKKSMALTLKEESVLPEDTDFWDWTIKEIVVPENIEKMVAMMPDWRVLTSFVVAYRYGIDAEADVVLSLEEYDLKAEECMVWQYDEGQYRQMIIHTPAEWLEEEDKIYPYVENGLLYINTEVYEIGSYMGCHPVVVGRSGVSN